MNNSNFTDDLSKEKLLSKFLDEYYSDIFSDSKYSIKRITEMDLQHQGVDLILDNGTSKFYVDEKAQLDYLNNSLPTFAFELSYLKNNSWRKGWLLDNLKITNIYFLITSIYTKNSNELRTGLTQIKITGIYREKLILFLSNKGLTETKLSQLQMEIRKSGKHGKIKLKELNPKTEGVIFYSKNNKNEQPINLVLKLDFLIKNNVGKIIFNL